MGASRMIYIYIARLLKTRYELIAIKKSCFLFFSVFLFFLFFYVFSMFFSVFLFFFLFFFFSVFVYNYYIYHICFHVVETPTNSPASCKCLACACFLQASLSFFIPDQEWGYSLTKSFDIVD